MAHRDRVGGSSGRRKGAGDAAHPPSAAAAPLLWRTGRQNFSTPSGGPVPFGRDAGITHTGLAPAAGKSGIVRAVPAPEYFDAFVQAIKGDGGAEITISLPVAGGDADSQDSRGGGSDT